MKSSESFELLLEKLSVALENENFFRRTQIFYKETTDSYGVIEVQRSRKSTSERILFTLNLGIASRRLLTAMNTTPNRLPLIEDCHWRQRLGFLLYGRDNWWELDGSEADEKTIDSLVRVLLEVAIPRLSELLNDVALRDLWLSGKSPGLTKIQALVNLMIILHEIGPENLIKSTMEKAIELSRGKLTESLVNTYINRLKKGNG